MTRTRPRYGDLDEAARQVLAVLARRHQPPTNPDPYNPLEDTKEDRAA